MRGRGVFAFCPRLPGGTIVALALVVIVLQPAPAAGQEGTGTISGVVTDVGNGVLPSAQVTLEPTKVTTATDNQGGYVIGSVAPGEYEVTVSYVGFKPNETKVTVAAGQTATVNVVMEVASVGEQVLVTTPRAHGEAETINVEQSTPTIIDHLPLKVIRSLPNPNIADAVNRLPSVTLERDEGEGKYVQIRGTEPRLNNLTVDGVVIPSPEGGVRQIKLDVVPSDLVDSVQIYKTLDANQWGDAIGGTVNLVTKTAPERPVGSLYFGQGYTPLASGGPSALVEEVAGTIGYRFGRDRRLGVIGSGSYDYNGRKTFDLEPVPDIYETSSGGFSPYYSGTDLRQYEFTRHRYGFGGSADYRIADTSSIYLRGLYSIFKDWGRRYAYTLATNPVLDGTSNTSTGSFNTEARLPIFTVSSLAVGGNHAVGKWLFNWELAAPFSRMHNPINGGENIATFTYAAGSTSNCQYDAAATKNVYEPRFSPACFQELYNPANLALSTGSIPAFTDTNYGYSEQLNLEALGSVARTYSFGSHAGMLEFGFNFRNAHKFDDSFEYDYTAINPIGASQFVTTETSPNYYYGAYPYGPFISWDRLKAFVNANPSDFTVANTLGGNPANFDLVERVSAGYLMNTLDFGRFRVVAGVRFEGTQYSALSYDNVKACLCAKNASSYLDILPSGSLAIRLDNHSDVRLAVWRGLARPDPTALTTAVSLDTTTTPFTYTIGNPSLKPEHAYDYDALYERSLRPIGLVRAGFFYKDISDPFVQLLTAGTGPFAGYNVLQPANGGSAHIGGIELEFQQHFTYLPGPLRGLGLFGNYSYTWSQAYNVDPGYRIDKPALLRQAPNTWNLAPTYDRGPFSIRVGLNYNGPNIYAYYYTACNQSSPGSFLSGTVASVRVDSSGNCLNGGIPTPFGKTGPLGDQYLYPHFQVDAQASFRLAKHFTALVSAWNLNNEVFGLYNGSPNNVLQREFYGTTYLVALRWETGER